MTRSSIFRRWVGRRLRQRGAGTRLSTHLDHARNWARRYVNGEFDIDFDTAAEIVAFFDATMDEALEPAEDARPRDGELDQLEAIWPTLPPVLKHALLDDARFYASLPRRLAK